MSNDYSRYALEVTPVPLSSAYYVACPTLGRFLTDADNEAEIIPRGRRAIKAFIAHLMRNGQPIPAAIPSETATYLVELSPDQAAEIAAYNEGLKG